MQFLKTAFSWASWTVTGFLKSIGLLSKNATIMLVGLDNAGKTTLLHMMAFGTLKSSLPTNRPTMEEMTLNGLQLRAYDLGGRGQQKRVWKDYFPLVDAIVFIVDASNPERFQAAAEELQGLLTIPEIELIPILVLGNKIDLPNAVSENNVRQALGLQITSRDPPSNWKEAGIRPLELFMCSIANKSGYGEGLLWLSKFL